MGLQQIHSTGSVYMQLRLVFYIHRAINLCYMIQMYHLQIETRIILVSDTSRWSRILFHTPSKSLVEGFV